MLPFAVFSTASLQCMHLNARCFELNQLMELMSMKLLRIAISSGLILFNSHFSDESQFVVCIDFVSDDARIALTAHISTCRHLLHGNLSHYVRSLSSRYTPALVIFKYLPFTCGRFLCVYVCHILVEWIVNCEWGRGGGKIRNVLALMQFNCLACDCFRFLS